MRNITNPVNALLKHFTITLFITIIGILIGYQLPMSMISLINGMFIVLLVLSFIMVIFCRRPKNGSPRRGFSMNITYGYALFLGITITPTINYYLQELGMALVLAVFVGTLLIVGTLSLLSYNKGTDSILKLGPILFISTICLFLVSLVLMFTTSFTSLEIIITIASVLIFSLWVVYDVYRFKRNSSYITNTNQLAPYVLDIYVDFINIFLDLLRLVARFAPKNR